MSVMHTPETAGAKAVYREDNRQWGEIERDVIGWDKQGRPLVMCGDHLEPAATAPFAHHTKFLRVRRLEVDFTAIVRDAVWDSLSGLRDAVSYAGAVDLEQIVRDVIEDTARAVTSK